MSNALSVFQILFTHCLILSFEVKDERIKYIFKKSKQVYWDISFYYSELHTTCNFVFACFSAGKKTHLVLFCLPTSMSDDSSNAPLLYIWYTPPPSMYCVPTFFFFVLNNVISNLVATVISFLQSICLLELKLWGWSVLDYNESISINIFKKKWTKTCTPKTRLFSERHLIGFVLTDTPGKVMW